LAQAYVRIHLPYPVRDISESMSKLGSVTQSGRRSFGPEAPPAGSFKSSRNQVSELRGKKKEYLTGITTKDDNKKELVSESKADSKY